MPSTTSSTVSADFDSSTVMTPSLPTFSIASAISLPMVLSLLEAIVATWAISFLSLVDFESFFSSSTTFSTACSMPRWSPMGFAPAVLGDGRAAVLLVQDDVPSLRPQGDLDRVGDDVDAAQERRAGFLFEQELLSHEWILSSGAADRRRPRQPSRSRE